MNLPNKLTMLRIIAIPIFIVFMIQKMFIASFVIFVLASITDFLDGYLARKLNLITNFGKLMDPLADKLLVISALMLFIDFGIMKSWMVFIIIARELIISIFRAVAASEGVVISAANSGKLKTIVQMVTVIFVLARLSLDIGFGVLSPELISMTENILIWLSVILTIVSGTEYIWKNRKLLKE